MSEERKGHKLVWAIIVFIFATFPQWISGVWALFSSEPFFLWVQSKGVKMLPFSLSWVTWPIGLLLLGLIAWREFWPQKHLPAKNNTLKIIPLPPQQIISNKFECLIEIENPSEDKDAENVKVEIEKIEPIPQHGPSKTRLPLRFPIFPQPKSNNPNVINPKDSARFLLFNVKQTFTEVEFEIVGVNHKLNTFTHGYFDFDQPFPKLKKPDVMDYNITITVSAKGQALNRQIIKLECPTRWIHDKPFTLTKI